MARILGSRGQKVTEIRREVKIFTVPEIKLLIW
jgi:hypothetical protein